MELRTVPTPNVWEFHVLFFFLGGGATYPRPDHCKTEDKENYDLD